MLDHPWQQFPQNMAAQAKFTRTCFCKALVASAEADQWIQMHTTAAQRNSALTSTPDSTITVRITPAAQPQRTSDAEIQTCDSAVPQPAYSQLLSLQH